MRVDEPIAQGWVLSLLWHGMAMGVVALLTAELKLVSQPEPFTWDVSLIETPAQPQSDKTSMNESAPAPSAAQAEIRRPLRPQPIEAMQQQHTPELVQRRTVETRQPIERAVPYDLREVRPVVNPVAETTAKPVVQMPQQETITRMAMPAPAPQQQPLPVESAPNVVKEMPPSQEKAMVQAPAQVAKVVPVETTHVESLETAEGSTAVRHVTEVTPLVQQRMAAVEPAITASQPTVLESQALRTEGPKSAPSATAVERASNAMPAVQNRPGSKQDFGWLAQALLSRVQQLKRYPHVARMNHWEGKVELRAVIRADGELVDIEVTESSGHRELDDDALNVMKQASPLHLPHALGQPQVAVRLPIRYRLEH
jgi:protein TonB